jgi:CheY-like chemotaxis protein
MLEKKSVPGSTPKPRAGYQRNLGPAYRRRVLMVSPFAADHRSLRSALNDQTWSVDDAVNYQKAIACLCCKRIDVIVCESHLPDGTWKDLLGHIAAMPDPPLLIVSAAIVDGHLRAEVLNLGAYALLVKPFDSLEAQQMLAGAGQARTAGTASSLG